MRATVSSRSRPRRWNTPTRSAKFLPDQDRPNEGVFSFQDDDEQWISLRYDLTAPLARYVAENFQNLALPYRSYRYGYVYRNEKPGPGRFRQFMQFDADTVGSASPAADAEICMMAADTMEALGIQRGQYVVKVNNRKILDGVREELGIASDGAMAHRDARASTSSIVLASRASRNCLAKAARMSPATSPRAQVSTTAAIKTVLSSVEAGGADPKSDIGRQGVDELAQISKLVTAAGYGEDRIKIDPSVVRGLEYYTGPVYEVELLLDTKDEKGRPVRFGSVGGGGRYDGLVSRFPRRAGAGDRLLHRRVAFAGGADAARPARRQA